MADPHAADTPPLLSIVVPAFNCAQYLERSIASAYAFCSQPLEVIVVDDGSTDSTPALCGQLQQQHRALRVIRQANGGLSAARNAGIDAAKGEFIVLLDADDELIPFDRPPLLDFDGDMMRIGVEEVGIEGDVQHWAESDDGSDGPTFLQRRLIARNFYVPSWAYIYRRSFINHQRLRFTHGLIHEDMLFTVQALMKAARVQATPTMLYRYFRRTGSITKTKDRTKLLARIDSLAIICRELTSLANDRTDVDLRWWIDETVHNAAALAQQLNEFRPKLQTLRMQLSYMLLYRGFGKPGIRYIQRERLKSLLFGYR